MDVKVHVPDGGIEGTNIDVKQNRAKYTPLRNSEFNDNFKGFLISDFNSLTASDKKALEPLQSCTSYADFLIEDLKEFVVI